MRWCQCSTITNGQCSTFPCCHIFPMCMLHTPYKTCQHSPACHCLHPLSEAAILHPLSPINLLCEVYCMVWWFFFLVWFFWYFLTLDCQNILLLSSWESIFLGPGFLIRGQTDPVASAFKGRKLSIWYFNTQPPPFHREGKVHCWQSLMASEPANVCAAAPLCDEKKTLLYNTERSFWSQRWKETWHPGGLVKKMGVLAISLKAYILKTYLEALPPC